MAHSMILLPDEPMQARRWDDRVGFFSLTQTDYGVIDGSGIRKHFPELFELGTHRLLEVAQEAVGRPLELMRDEVMPKLGN